jgi:small redox-active disulfide protein 2
MKIDVYGPGCPNCKRLEQLTKDALANLGEDAEVTKVEDFVAIADAGVMRTPALGIDGKLVLQGRVPGVQELSTIIAKVRDGVR